jgi:hypothetical protein
MAKVQALNDLELYTISTCKSKNAVNSAILMNPTNYFAPNPLTLFSPLPSPIPPIIISENKLGAYNNLNPNLYNTDSVPNRNMPPLTNIKRNGQLTYQRTNGWFHKWSPMFSAILKITEGPDDLFCAMGITAAFTACNPQKGNIYSNTGGFPGSSSSQLIVGSTFKDIKTFRDAFDYDEKGYLTDNGLIKAEAIRNWKGAVYNFTYQNNTGHIGMVLGAEILQEPITKKYRCWLYTLEYNTKISSANDPSVINNPEEFIRQNLAIPGINYYMRTELSKNPKYILRKPNGVEDPQWSKSGGNDERTGGKLAFRIRLLGGKGSKPITRYALGNTENFNGGSWAPNGLTQANEYLSIGNWKENKKIFEV